MDLALGRSAQIGPPFLRAGTAGRITNCQIGVSAAFVSSEGHAVIDRRLHLPEDWTSNRERLVKAHVPVDVGFATKPAVTVAPVQRASASAAPFAWVAADAVCGVGAVAMALRRTGKDKGKS